MTRGLAIPAQRMALVGLLAIGFSLSAMAQTVSFIARHDYLIGSTGSNPKHVAVGDFNGDGIADLAVTARNANAVFVLPGRGDGIFGPPSSAPVANEPEKLVVADFNGDGRLDLAVSVYQDNAVSILLGRGDGTFQTGLRLATPSPGGSAMAVGDFNGDAKQDLTTANSQGTMSVFMGNGNGTFGPPRTYPSGNFPVSVAAGDLNRDGRPDIAVANETSHTISVFLGNGDGTFQPAAQYPAGRDPFSVVMADLNRDGNPDLVSANYNSDNVFVSFGSGTGGVNGTGSFGVGTHPWEVTAPDLNGDGVPDLATANSGANSVSVLVSNGDGTCQPAQSIVVGTAAHFSPTGVVAGDLNGDGLQDLVSANGPGGTISVLINSTHGAVIGERVAWVNAVNATPAGNSLRKTGGCDGCYDAGAVSEQQILPGPDYAEAEFTTGDATSLRVVGLTHAFREMTPEDIDFGIRLQAGAAEVRENGEYRASTLFAAGDSFRIAIQSGALTYLKNGVPFYTRAATPMVPLFLAAALANAGASIDNASITGRAESRYGQLLLPPLLTRDASALSNDIYDTVQLALARGPRDRFFLSSTGGVPTGDILGRSFTPLIVADQVHFNGVDAGLGPHSFQPGVPPVTLYTPIEMNLVPLPPLELGTDLIPEGQSTIRVELLATQRTIYGHTALYLVRDCGIWLAGNAPTSINWITHDHQVAGTRPEFDVRHGRLSQLHEDRDFSRASCLGRFFNTRATDATADPPPGEGYYYLARGLDSCVPQGYGDSSLAQDPRDTLDALPACM